MWTWSRIFKTKSAASRGNDAALSSEFRNCRETGYFTGLTAFAAFGAFSVLLSAERVVSRSVAPTTFTNPNMGLLRTGSFDRP
jgi:hypothetical protein